MNNIATLDKLRCLKLDGMVQALEEQRRDPKTSDLDFEERLALLVERQWINSQNRSLSRRLINANFKISCALEQIDYHHSRGLKRSQIEQMQAAQWIDHHLNCLILGPAGVGKTFIACALGHQACRDGAKVAYYYAPKLFRNLHLAGVDGTLNKLLKQLLRADLLIVDDIGIASVKPQQYREFLEVIDDRGSKGSTLITSQVPVEQWHQLISDATLADAILDRLVHNAYTLNLKGESIRKQNRTVK